MVYWWHWYIYIYIHPVYTWHTVVPLLTFVFICQFHFQFCLFVLYFCLLVVYVFNFCCKPVIPDRHKDSYLDYVIDLKNWLKSYCQVHSTSMSCCQKRLSNFHLPCISWIVVQVLGSFLLTYLYNYIVYVGIILNYDNTSSSSCRWPWF